MSNIKRPAAVERKNKAGTADGREATKTATKETTIAKARAAGNQIREFHIIRHRTIKLGVQIAAKEQPIQRQGKLEIESLNSI